MIGGGPSAVVASVIRSLATTGISQRAGLRIFRDAGLHISDASFRSIWNTARAQAQFPSLLIEQNPTYPIERALTIPVQPDEIGRTYGVRKNFLWEFTLIGTDPSTGESVEITRRLATYERLSPSQALAHMLSRYRDDQERERYPVELEHISVSSVLVRGDYEWE